MGTAWFRFYAELNDLLPSSIRQREFALVFREERRTVKDMIESLGIPHTEVDLILVNGSSAGFDRRIEDRDRISVYPVFEGMDVSSVTLLRPRPLRSTRLLVEGFEHKLVRYLRAIGLDVEHETVACEDELWRRCREEARILISSSPALLKRKYFDRAVLVPRGPLIKRLSLVVSRLDLLSSLAPFSRCLICNRILDPATAEQIQLKVPPGAAAVRKDFMSCPSCGKVYWGGSHVRAMEQIIKAVLDNRSA